MSSLAGMVTAPQHTFPVCLFTLNLSNKGENTKKVNLNKNSTYCTSAAMMAEGHRQNDAHTS